jgi:4-amino-4-deoxy-L-arabinose transferase-like glycosyltransferase
VRVRSRRQDRVFTCAAVVLAVLIAFGLRAFRIDASWDLGQDELDYLQMSQGVLRTMWVVGWDGGPFYIHPPLFFFLEAAYMKLFGITNDLDLIQQIHAVRYLNAAIGGLSAGALLWLGRRLAGWSAGIAAAAFFALDPFSIKMNSLNMLEASTVLWVLLGYVVLFSALGREGNQRVSWLRAVVVGVVFGLALLTKEKSAFVTLLPLGICFVLGWTLPRTRCTLAGVVALIVYAPYLVIVYVIGDWGTFVEQKSAGVLRMAGLIQTTGFNQQGGPSFLDALLHRLDEYAVTYAFLATGAVSVCVLFFMDPGNRASARRLLVSWAASAYAFLGYAMVFGTSEEHFFYYLVVPSILITAVATVVVLRTAQTAGAREHAKDDAARGARGRWPLELAWGARGWRRARRTLQIATTVSVAALALWSGYVWAVVHAVPDNGYERVAYYFNEDIPEGSRVAVTSAVAEVVLRGYAGDGPYRSVRALRADHIDYVITSSYLANNGYKQPPLEVYRWVKDHGKLVYGFEGRTHGLMGVWRLQMDEAEYLAEVGDIQNGSVEAFLKSDERLRRYDALDAADVEGMRANLVDLEDYRDRAADLDPPERYRGQHETFGLAIGELYEAAWVAHRVVNDPASATQSDFAAYDDHVEKAAAHLRRANEMVRRDFKTIEGA